MSKILKADRLGRVSRDITSDHNTINVLESETEKRAKVEMWIASQVGAALVKRLPNRQWGVRVDIQGGMIIISCDSVSLEKGYYISMEHRTINELQQRAVMAGSEILERHGLSREKLFNADIFETMERDAKDNIVVQGTSADAEPISK